jgi:hypothetical protein
MTITINIEIAEVPLSAPGRNEFGAGVKVQSKLPPSADLVGDAEGSTWVGLCMAINKYMRERGVADFDCLKARPM